MVDITKQAAALGARGVCDWIDANPAHKREIDHQPVVADTKATTVMPTAPDSEGEALFARS